MKKFVLVFILFFLLSLNALAVSYPGNPEGYVNDYADLLSSTKKSELEQKISNFEKETGNEIALVTVNSLEGITVEEYAGELFEKWGIGKKDLDNGVLFLIALEDKEMRIEVGYGLEGELTDAESKLILENEVKPLFRQERYEEGIEAGVDQIMGTIKGEIEPEVSTAAEATPLAIFIPIFFAIFGAVWQFVIFGIVIFVIILILKGRRGGRGGRGPGVFWGGVSGGGFRSGGFGGFSGGGGGFGGFGGGSSGGGGASSGW